MRAVRLALAAAIAVVLLYTMHRALVLRVDYYDSYEYLRNARALLGDSSAKYWELRPPFIPIVQLPATAIAIFSASASSPALRDLAGNFFTANLGKIRDGGPRSSIAAKTANRQWRADATPFWQDGRASDR